MGSDVVQSSQIIVEDFNDTHDPQTLGFCVHRLFEQAVKRHKDNVAIICGSKSITYEELNTLANRIARVLLQQGVKNGDLVGVMLDRSVDLVAVLLAVLKTGAAYVPIDPAFPVARINQMMEDACPKLLVTGVRTLETCIAQKYTSLGIDEILDTVLPNPNIGNLGLVVQSHDLAYVMYTSGSTGRPKGVEVTHDNVSNLLLSMRIEPGCSERDRLLAVTTVSFDMAVLELYLPLCCGATSVIAQSTEVRDGRALITLIECHKITMMQGTPATWQLLLSSGWCGESRLSKILCGGEALSRHLADKLLTCGDMIWNMYGPTEATVYGSIWRVQQDQDILIGTPIRNGRLYILDANKSPLPVESVGELYIGGAGVARGYRNNSELTKSRFLNNPFHGGFMYRTGDLCRRLGNGAVALRGRIDGQVKIRGYRIELGDVEATICDHDNISAAVVIPHDDRLAAYCVRETKPSRASHESERSLGQLLRSWLVERLPAYMVPAFFIEVNALPITLNGKIDRKALPDPVASIQSRSSVRTITDVEGQILQAWSSVLGHDHFGLDDNFFEVGGDSLRVVSLQKDLERLLDRPILVSKLFEHYTVKTLAAYLISSSDRTAPPKVARQFRANDVDDIAIISLACRLPGGCETPEDFWELLERGGDAVSDLPEGRWNVEGLYDKGEPGLKEPHTFRGGFLCSINAYDISFFGISPREARSLDPSQYLMLETCWEAFERASYTMTRLHGSQTGVFIGTSNILSHQTLNSTSVKGIADLDGYTVTGSAAATMAGRVAYQLGLEGPTMTVDTACSSSLVTTHLACNALRQGECDMAISGGVTLMLNPGLHIEFSRLHGMSSDGRCRSFAANTEGTGWAEGSAAVLLKRLCDAQRDGDRIYGVIRGSAVNHDGRSATLTTPSGAAQKRLIQTALFAARLEPDEIDYIEGHGTGTKMGDPIEAMALAEVFGPTRAGTQPLFVGSAKSNIAHTQAAAGLVGLIKVVLAIQHSTIPQTLHVSEPTPALDWHGAHMTPAMTKTTWPPMDNRRRRAGISAFGIGGTNAHVIIEEPPSDLRVVPYEKAEHQLPSLLPFFISGDTDAALQMQAKKLHQYISRKIDLKSVSDVAYSLATTRNHLRRRVVVMADGKADLLVKLQSTSYSDLAASPVVEVAETPRLAMIFTGQGSQWSGMGKDLYEAYPIFRDTMNDISARFTELDMPLLDVMWADPASRVSACLERTDFSQPAIFALEVALWRLWASWGVQPSLVLGHSLGELVAAYVAGILDLSDACRIVATRSRLMQARSGDSKMVSLGATAVEVAAAIEQFGHSSQIEIAIHNAPRQTVISGEAVAAENLKDHFATQGRKVKTLIDGHAFHSRQMDGMLAEFRAVVENVHFKSPRINIISGLSGKLAKPGELEQADYWVRQVREPVLFSSCMQASAQYGANIFLELGPQRILCGIGAECLSDHATDRSVTWLPSLIFGKNAIPVLQRSMVDLHLQQIHVDWAAFWTPFGGERVELPTYAFQRDFLAFSVKNNHEVVKNSKSLGKNYSAGNQRHFEFAIDWQREKTSQVFRKETWGVLRPLGEVAWAEDVAVSLSQAGIQLVEVKELSDTRQLAGLICLWDSDAVQLVDETLTKALILLQTAVQTQHTSPIIWVTRYAVGTGVQSDDRFIRLSTAPLWGLMRTARNEHPELQLRLIDVGKTATTTSLASALFLNTEPECVVRQDQLYVSRMQYVDSPTTTLAPQRFIRTDGAVLITGGLGGLGARVARWLASEHGIKDIVLTSRHGRETPGADALVAELSKFNVRVTVMAGNIASSDSVSSIIALFDGKRPLRAVIHAAGVTDSAVLTGTTSEQCAKALAPKAYGAWLLHQATQNMHLDVFMMFSSISGIMGMQGLANYAAANTFLDALAYMRRSQGLPATSVAYGTWEGTGMASKLSANTLKHLEYYGLAPLATDEGLKLLEQAVLSTRAMTVAAALDFNQLQTYFEERGDIPPLLQNLLAQRKSSVVHGEPFRKLLNEAGPQHSNNIMLWRLREIVCKELGFNHPSNVDIERPLQDMGIDSLTAVQMRNHLATLTGLKLSVNITLVHPNLQLLSNHLLSRLIETDPAYTSRALRSTNTVSTTVKPCHLNMDAICKGFIDSGLSFNMKLSDKTGCMPRSESVFLTGATGFVGADILSKLLKHDRTTYCLVRADSIEQARKRLVDTLKAYDIWEANFESLMIPVVGDMAKPLLGLSEQVFDALAEQIDIICHSGALVDWMRPLEDYVGPNIVSSHELLRLASRGSRKSLHLISTISTLSLHMGLELDKGDQDFGYGTSKFIAERLVTAARWRGLEATIYRLPYVTASSSTGHFRRDRGDFLHNLIVGSLELGAFPSLDADLRVVLPIDYLSETIVAVMLRDPQRRGRDYDFLNMRALSCDDFFKRVGIAYGKTDIVPFDTWKQRALDYAAAKPRSSLARISAVLDSYANETAADMFKGLFVGEHVFGVEDYPAPLLDDKYIGKYLERIKTEKSSD